MVKQLYYSKIHLKITVYIATYIGTYYEVHDVDNIVHTKIVAFDNKYYSINGGRITNYVTCSKCCLCDVIN